MKQTIKERVDGICKRNKTYYKNGGYGYNIEDIKQELDKAYKDHFIEIIDDEINNNVVDDETYKSLMKIKSKLMEGK